MCTYLMEKIPLVARKKHKKRRCWSQRLLVSKTVIDLILHATFYVNAQAKQSGSE